MSTATRPERRTALDTAFATFSNTTRFHSLDGWRFFAVLIVIKSHVAFAPSNLEILNWGYLGVDLFFVISGFLITTLLIRERAQFGDISLKKFYLRRTFRIFPIYYLLVLSFALFYLVISPWKPNGWAFYAWSFPVLLTYTQDFVLIAGVFFHCWSLAVEEQFYLVWPAIEKYLSGTRKWAIFAVLLVINQLVNFGAADRMIGWIYGHADARLMPVWGVTFTPILLGVLLAHLLADRSTFNAFFRLLSNRFTPIVLLLAIAASLQWIPQNLEGPPRLTLHILLMLLVASVVIAPGNYLQPVLDHPLIVRLGTISYGIYLYHVLIMMGVERVLKRLESGSVDPLLLFLVAVGATSGAAELSYRFIETPFLRLKARLGRRGQEAVAAPPATAGEGRVAVP
jgi:peptidoglycan/LPS O-acetylase OafA/YrhL